MHIILSQRRKSSQEDDNPAGYMSDGPLGDIDGKPRGQSHLILGGREEDTTKYQGKFAKIKQSKSPKSSPVLRHRTKSTVSAPDSSLLVAKRLSRSYDSLDIAEDMPSSENSESKEVEEIVEPVQGKPPKGERRGTLSRLFTKAKSSFDLFAKAEKAEKQEKEERSKTDTTQNEKQPDNEDDIPWKPRPRATSEPLKAGQMLFNLVAFDDVTKSLDDLSSERNIGGHEDIDAPIKRETSDSGSVFLPTDQPPEEPPPDYDDIEDYELSTSREIQPANTGNSVIDDPREDNGDSSDDDIINESTILHEIEPEDNYELIFEMEMDKSFDHTDQTENEHHNAPWFNNTSPVNLTNGNVMFEADKSLGKITKVDYGDYYISDTLPCVIPLDEEAERSNSKKKPINTEDRNVAGNRKNSSEISVTDELINLVQEISNTNSEKSTDHSNRDLTSAMGDVKIVENMLDFHETDEFTFNDDTREKDDIKIFLEVQTDNNPAEIHDFNKTDDEGHGIHNESITIFSNITEEIPIPNQETKETVFGAVHTSSLTNVELQRPEDFDDEDISKHAARDISDVGNIPKTEVTLSSESTMNNMTTNETPVTVAPEQKHRLELDQIQSISILSNTETSDVECWNMKVQHDQNLPVIEHDEQTIEFECNEDLMVFQSSLIPDVTGSYLNSTQERNKNLLRNVNANEVLITNINPIGEKIQKLKPVKQNVMAVEVTTDRAFNFTDETSVVTCNCSTTAYNLKPTVCKDNPALKQDTQIVTPAIEENRLIVNKNENRAKMGDDNTNGNEFENEANTSVNTERNIDYSTKLKIYVYHTKIVLETIAQSGSSQSPNDLPGNVTNINRNEEISKECVSEDNRGGENREAEDKARTDHDDSGIDHQQPGDFDLHVPVPVIRIESRTSAESCDNGKETIETTEHPTITETLHNYHSVNIDLDQNDTDVDEPGADPEFMKLQQDREIASDSYSSCDQQPNTQTDYITNEVSGTLPDAEIADIDNEMETEDYSQAQHQEKIPGKIVDGLCPTETTDRISEILNELETSCNVDDEEEVTSMPKDTDDTAPWNKSIKRQRSISSDKVIPSEIQSVDEKESISMYTHRDNMKDKMDFVSQACSNKELTNDKKADVMSDSETSSNEGSIPHPDKDEALETCKSIRIRNLINLFETGVTKKSRSSTLPRSKINPSPSVSNAKSNTTYTLPRNLTTAQLTKGRLRKIPSVVPSNNNWPSMPNLAQKKDDSQNHNQEKEPNTRTGTREEIKTLQKKKFVSSVILKFQQLENQSSNKAQSFQPIKSQRRDLKRATAVGRAKSTSNLASYELNEPQVNQSKPQHLSTGNLLYEKQLLSYCKDDFLDINSANIDNIDSEIPIRKWKSEVFFTDSHESDSSRTSSTEQSFPWNIPLPPSQGFRKPRQCSNSSDLSDGYLAEGEDSDVSPATKHLPVSFMGEVFYIFFCFKFILTSEHNQNSIVLIIVVCSLNLCTFIIFVLMMM